MTLGSYSLQLTAGELTEWVFSPLRGICQPSCSVTTKKQKNDPLSCNNASPLFFSFNSKIPPKPVETEKSQNPQPSHGYVSVITLIFVRRSVPEGCFHSHKPAQGRYLSESPIKNIHTPKDKNDKSRLGLGGEEEKGESHHLSENSATLSPGPSSGLAKSGNSLLVLHTEQGVSRFPSSLAPS